MEEIEIDDYDLSEASLERACKRIQEEMKKSGKLPVKMGKPTHIWVPHFLGSKYGKLYKFKEEKNETDKTSV